VHLEGRGGNDSLQGSEGDDSLDGGAGADIMYGFGGHNIYIVDNVGDIVGAGGAGVDEMRTSLDSFDGTTAWGGNLIDKVVYTGTGSFTGVLRASGGMIVGGAGNDTLTGASGGIFDGGQTFVGGAGNDMMTGADDLPDTADYSAATTQVTVGLAIVGAQATGASTGRDRLSGIENLRGSDWSDRLTGDGASNRLEGGSGDDTVIGGAGADSLLGGQGNDNYIVDDAGDSVTELALQGTDTVKASVSCTIGANVEDLILSGTAAIGGTGNGLGNTIAGNAAANILDGGSGNDRLIGNWGNDTLVGGGGSDTLIGAMGNDSLTGGAGADRFKFVTVGERTDSIGDFASGADRILVVSASFGALPVGPIAPDRFVAGGVPLTTGAAVFVYTAATGVLAFDSDGNGAGTAIPIAVLTGPKGLAASDIKVVAA
jgi:Ca2+-binding RTX toxin-like protein